MLIWSKVKVTFDYSHGPEPERPSALGVLVLNLTQAGSVTRVRLKAHHTYFLQIIIKIMFDISKIRIILGNLIFGNFTS